ncbi:hypothetical protein [Eleftheria terrae]|uniref:hypothetical protein n=1 Tax=Eleftheria terrae TaxID=1597781 RepID=UPI00263B13E2|nr:hypothetical protein [Eleftheria terrae]WKB55577.1 hypothetical protein N7L95_26245 [Eleftheria terrae]
MRLLGEEPVVVGFGVADAPNDMRIDQAAGARRQVKAEHPGLRRSFHRQIHTDESQGWPFATTMQPLTRP